MPTLNKPTLGTPKNEGWPFYSLHMMNSLMMREYFNVSNYRESVQLTKMYGSNLQRVLNDNEDTLVQDREKAIKKAQELCNWASEMEEQNYHELHVHAFISIWSSFEAGIENIVADFLHNDIAAAQSVEPLFKPGKIGETKFPWNKETCIRVAGMLENKAKNGNNDLISRYKTLFNWLGVDFSLEAQYASDLAEANSVRNILLHRYGQIGEKDAINHPRLKEWQGSELPFTRELFDRYYDSISKFLVVLMKGIASREIT